MIDSLLKGTLALAVLILSSAIIAGALTGSPTADFRPVLSVAKWLAISWTDTQQAERDPAPFREEAEEAIGSLQTGASQLIDQIPDDPRLATCPEGSIDPLAETVPKTVAESLKTAQGQGIAFPSLLAVQAQLGVPACNWRSGGTIRWRFLVENGGLLDVTETASQIKLSFFL